jgi:hypothetical protein
LFSAWLGLASSIAPLSDAARAAGARSTAVVPLEQGKTVRFVFIWAFSSPLANAAKGWRVVPAAGAPAHDSRVAAKVGDADGSESAGGGAAAGVKRSAAAAEAGDSKDAKENVRAFAIRVSALVEGSAPLLRSAHSPRVGSGVFSLRASATDEAHIVGVAADGVDAQAPSLTLADVEARIDDALRSMNGGSGGAGGGGGGAGGSSARSFVALFWKPEGPSAVDVASSLRPFRKEVSVGTALLYRGALFEGDAPRATVEVHVLVGAHGAEPARERRDGPTTAAPLAAVVVTCLVSVTDGSRALFDRFASALERDVVRQGRKWRRARALQEERFA